MVLDNNKTTGDSIQAAEWNEAATAANKVTDKTIPFEDLSNITFTTLSSNDTILYNGANFVNVDFDTEVSNNTDVAANTTARHDAVTVTDSAEINFTLTGQDITASLVSGSIDETKLDTSVNASLDLADSALQSGDNISVLTNDSGYITNISSFSTTDLSEGTNLYFTNERVDDRVNTLLVAGTNITKTYDDVANTLTLDATGNTTEEIQDIVGGMVTTNTETLITVTYQDADGTLDFVVNNDLSLYDNTTSGFLTDITAENIGDLSNVTITTPADNEILAYDNGTSTWINQTASEAGLITASSTDTLTNKTIDANNNTINNLALGAEVTGASTSLTDTADITYNADIDVSGNAWVLDEDTMTSNSATKVPTQQSVKAYVDASSPDFYTENADGFVIDGGTTSNRTLTVSGGNVEFDGAGTIADGNLLTGNTANNAFELNTNINISAAGDIGYNTAYNSPTALGNLGATEIIDWSSGTHFEGTLDSDVTITHSNEVSGQKITLALAYDGTAQRTITWSDVDKWQGGTAPDSPAASGEVLVVTLFFIGTTCYGSGGIFS